MYYLLYRGNVTHESDPLAKKVFYPYPSLSVNMVSYSFQSQQILIFIFVYNFFQEVSTIFQVATPLGVIESYMFSKFCQAMLIFAAALILYLPPIIRRRLKARNKMRLVSYEKFYFCHIFIIDAHRNLLPISCRLQEVVLDVK